MDEPKPKMHSQINRNYNLCNICIRQVLSLLLERHVTKMAMMLTRRLIDQRAMVAASQQQPSNLVVFVQMSLII